MDILLSFGSNLGDKRRALEHAWQEIGTLPMTVVVRISTFYETEPVGGPANQPDFLNAVGVIQTALTPQTLLEKLQEIEHRFGRIRTEHWGPRTLDIDILLYGDLIVSTPTLTIPHPEMLRRRFVLEPAMEIAAEMIHPITGSTLAEHFYAHLQGCTSLEPIHRKRYLPRQ